MITLYSTGCPQCKVLEEKLNDAGIDYVINSNQEDMIEKGIGIVPVLEVNGEQMIFSQAIKWLKERNN